MRVLICWSRVSGYMSACWKRLAAQADVDLRILAWDTAGASDQAAFNSSLIEPLNCRLLSPNERQNSAIVCAEVASFSPDIIVVPGWLSHAYTDCLQQLRRERPRVVMAMDTPWAGKPTQYLTRFRHRSLLGLVDHVVVAGERTWQYARRLGFDEAQISRGVYGWDDAAFGQCHQSPKPQSEVDSFVFVGRFAEEKGVRTLMDAYAKYRNSAANPWQLTMCGRGPLADIVRGAGVDCRGFVQPADLPGILDDATVFVLPSHYEPWGVALAEAMGAGLPVICSEACGASVDLVRSYWNGLLVPTGNTSSLTEAMRWFHHNRAQIPGMRDNARTSAAPFSAGMWATRWKQMLQSVAAQQGELACRRAA